MGRNRVSNRSLDRARYARAFFVLAWSIFFFGCTETATISTPEQTAPPTPELTEGEFSRLPLIPARSETVSTTIRWQEPYPQITHHGTIIARFPAPVNDLVLANDNGSKGLYLNPRYQTLEWNGIRTRGMRTVTVHDESGAVRYRFTLDVQPSSFLTDAFTLVAGSGAEIQRWWVEQDDGSYFYAGGLNRMSEVLHYQFIFAYPLRHIDPYSVADDYAVLRARDLSSGTLSNIHRTVANSRYRVINTTALQNTLVRNEESLCAPPAGARNPDYNHNYVVTRAITHTASNGEAGRVQALNGSQHFLLLEYTHQRNCFARSHLFEVLPEEKPSTTAAERMRLPSNTLYPHDYYDLVYKEDFAAPTSLQDLWEEGYREFLQSGADGKHKMTATTLDDPIKVEDGMLHIGYGVEAVSGQECRENTPDEVNLAKCRIVTSAESFSIPYRFKYGLLEVDLVRSSSYSLFVYMWLHSHPQWAGIGWPKPRGLYAGTEFVSSRTLGLRTVFDGIDSYEWESRFWGSEFELLEELSSQIGVRQETNTRFWIVNHYRKRKNPWNPHKNDSYSLYTTVQSDQRLRYAIEWTPQGYLLWLDRNNAGYRHLQKSEFSFWTQENGSVCRLSQRDREPVLVRGRPNHDLIMCGVNHTPMQLQINAIPRGRSITESLTPSPNPAWRYIAVDSIRLYKPKNNYADLTPLYE